LDRLESLISRGLAILPTNCNGLSVGARSGARVPCPVFECSATVPAVLSADETFIRFNESCNHCIAPKGIKRVEFSAKENDKAGVALLPTLDMTSSRLLPPLIIFKAKFAVRLMKQWASYTKSYSLYDQTRDVTVL